MTLDPDTIKHNKIDPEQQHAKKKSNSDPKSSYGFDPNPYRYKNIYRSK